MDNTDKYESGYGHTFIDSEAEEEDWKFCTSDKVPKLVTFGLDPDMD